METEASSENDDSTLPNEEVIQFPNDVEEPTPMEIEANSGNDDSTLPNEEVMQFPNENDVEEPTPMETEANSGNDDSTLPNEEVIQFPNENAIYANGIFFLSNDDFDFMTTVKHDAEEAIGWKVLPENVIYRVEKTSPIQTKWGSRFIVQLRNVMGQDIKVWAPSNVVRDLKSGYKLNGKDCIAFIKSLGERETNVIGEAKKKFFDFETVYVPQSQLTII